MDAILSAYIECALWSSLHEPAKYGASPVPFDEVDADLSDAAIETMRADVAAFLELCQERGIEWREHWSAGQVGHDFWLTRNGHGAGFWDRYYGDQPGTHIGRELTAAAETFGNCDLYLSDAGEIEIL